MIPSDLEEWIFPELDDGTDEAAVLHHECGIAFQFCVKLMDSQQFVITNQHLSAWRTTIEKIAAIAGHNCFSYNTLRADSDGVYHDEDGNTFAVLFAPSTFLEHNQVDGKPLFLVISEPECILTGSQSEAGTALLTQYSTKAAASHVVTIDSKWDKWIVEVEFA